MVSGIDAVTKREELEYDPTKNSPPADSVLLALRPCFARELCLTSCLQRDFHRCAEDRDWSRSNSRACIHRNITIPCPGRIYPSTSDLEVPQTEKPRNSKATHRQACCYSCLEINHEFLYRRSKFKVEPPWS